VIGAEKEYGAAGRGDYSHGQHFSSPNTAGFARAFAGDKGALAEFALPGK